ncbi:hypothetical protein G6F24_016535 [Rhizopus arrhizus]|nr:hypothetical protein G6F24_016535 [Rhizopus arrhizus]
MMPSGAHQQRRHHHQEQRHAGLDRVLAAGRILDRTAGFQQVAAGQFGADAVQRRQDLVHHVQRLHAIADVGAHGHRRQAVAMPDDAVLEAVLHRRHLRQRDAAAVGGGHRQARQQFQLVALIGRAAQQHLDLAVACAVHAHRLPGQ